MCAITATRDGAVEGIVLDAVGTLIEPEPSVAAAYAEAASRQGVELDRAEIKRRFRRHFGADEQDELRGPMATDEVTEYRRWQRIVAHTLPEVPDPGRAFDELWAHFARPESWRVFPDVAPALRALDRAGIPVRIGSNFDGRLRTVIAGLSELAPLQDAIVISAEVGYRKPHPEFYRAACFSLGLPPESVLCVGDDLENDYHGPRRAGLRAVLLTRNGSLPKDAPSVSSLLALVEPWIDPERRTGEAGGFTILGTI